MIRYGTLQVPPEFLPSASSSDIGPRSSRERRMAVFQNRGVSLLSLGDVDRHVKHMAKLDFVFAILSLGGLGVAVSDCVRLQWMMCLRCNA